MSRMGREEMVQAIASHFGVQPDQVSISPTGKVDIQNDAFETQFSAAMGFDPHVAEPLGSRVGQCWTEGESDLVGKLFNEGRALDEIARVTARTERAVVFHLEKRGDLLKIQRKAFEVTGILIPVEYRGTMFTPHGHGASPAFTDQEELFGWFRQAHKGTLMEPTFVMLKICGDAVESEAVHPDRFNPEREYTFEIKGRFKSPRRIGSDELKDSVKLMFDGDLGLDDYTVASVLISPK